MKFLPNFTKTLLDFIYPSICQICAAKITPEDNNRALCRNCLEKIIFIKSTVPFREKNAVIWAVCAYEGIIRKCVHLFKYKAKLSLLKPINQLMSNFINIYLKSEKFDTIIPIPLHRIRLRERGFNQAELLAKEIATSTKLHISLKALKRTKPTLTQAGLSKTERFINLKGAFKINKNSDIEGKHILLIDDVFTTGSTINECAKVLLKAGAKSTDALVLAKGI